MDEMKTVEQWAKEKGHTWQFAAAKTFSGWSESFECSEYDYDTAVVKASGLSFGYGVKK